MGLSGIHKLRQALGEARQRADELSGGAHGEPPGVGYLADPDGVLESKIRAVASHDGELTLFVGAGVSMEAGLPSWHELVARLLDAVGGELSDEERAEWVARILEEGPLAAAAVARALHPGDVEFRRALRGALYGGRRSTDYVPGALAGQLAWLRRELGPRVRLLTANFDGLLEAALTESKLTPISYVRARKEPAGKVAVWHLHGRLMQARDGDWLREGQLVLLKRTTFSRPTRLGRRSTWLSG